MGDGIASDENSIASTVMQFNTLTKVVVKIISVYILNVRLLDHLESYVVAIYFVVMYPIVRARIVVSRTCVANAETRGCPVNILRVGPIGEVETQFIGVFVFSVEIARDLSSMFYQVVAAFLQTDGYNVTFFFE